jgi:hypothetical protein
MTPARHQKSGAIASVGVMPCRRHAPDPYSALAVPGGTRLDVFAVRAVSQAAPIRSATRRYSFETLNFAANSPEDKHRDRRHRSARLERTELKGLIQIRRVGARLSRALRTISNSD